MSDEKVLTKEITEQILADGDSVDLRADHATSEMLGGCTQLNTGQRQDLLELVKRMLS